MSRPLHPSAGTPLRDAQPQATDAFAPGGAQLWVYGRGQDDPFALPLASPVEDFQRRVGSGSAGGGAQPTAPPGPGAPPAGPAGGATHPRPPSHLDMVGSRAAATLSAIDFPGFVASLIKGTFDAVVQSSIQQMRAFADLVSSLSQTADEFAQQNVHLNQVRVWLAETYPLDLRYQPPLADTGEKPKLVPTKKGRGKSPAWLSRFGHEGATLEDEFTDGPLVTSARNVMAQRKMQQLATLVLMGVNRIIIERGDITAKLQFHIEANEDMAAVVGTGNRTGLGDNIAGGGTSASAARVAVSTVSANVQSNASIRADLMGQVSLRFSSETFPLERFADSMAIQLINGHATPPRTDGPAATDADEDNGRAAGAEGRPS